jgi:hypothetical protein
MKSGIRMVWPKRIVVAIVLLALYGSFFCYFLAPTTAFWLFLLSLVLLMPLSIFLLEALYERRWQLVAVLVFICCLVALPFFPTDVPYWFESQGFRVLTWLSHDYRSGCRLTDFVENGVKQTAGFCEGFDRVDHLDFVVYDTTGEFLFPVVQRTPEWKQVMSAATEKSLVSKEHRASRLFGNYYVIFVNFEDLSS